MSDTQNGREGAAVAKPVKGSRGAARSAPAGGARGALRKAADFYGSFGMAVTLLLLLFVLTLLGTLEQQHAGLYDVQKKYFESWVVVHWFGPVMLPLPGATLVMAVLSGSLILGGVIRLRRGTSTIGILVAHLGILLLFAGGLVETLLSDKGQLTLYEGESSAEFQSYYDWEIAVTERRPGGGATDVVIGHERLADLSPDDVARFTASDLPFELRVAGWARNSRPRRIGLTAGSGDVDGWVIDLQDPELEAERNIPGAYVTLVPTSGAPQRGILWGAAEAAWVATLAGRRFEIDLRQRRWTLPFRVALKRFVHKQHPGTSMASQFSSYVTKTEGGVAEERHITMNEPLRHKGYTLYQSSWGPQKGEPDRRLFSTFSVVRNPADHVPAVAWWVILAGLVYQMGRKLLLHISAESKAAKAHAAAPRTA